MKLGLFMNTHGIGATVDEQWTLQPVPAEDMAPLTLARQAEAGGLDSLWFSDHVLVTIDSASLHNSADLETGQRAYAPSPDLLDCCVTMGAVAAVTERVQLGTSVLIAPYRHPLSDARRLSTIEALAPGRLIAGIGAGWLREEFEALGVDYDHRVAVTAECIEVYKRCWRDRVVSFQGEHFSFSDVSMDPKPATQPPIVFGGVTNLAARIAARHCDGFYPTFVDTKAEPKRYDSVLIELEKELDRVGRSTADMTLLAVVSARVLDANRTADDRAFCKGTAEEVIEDMAALGKQGFSHLVVHLDCRSGTVTELLEQTARLSEQVAPHVRGLTPFGGWGSSI